MSPCTQKSLKHVIFLVGQVIVTISFSHNRISNQRKYLQIFK